MDLIRAAYHQARHPRCDPTPLTGAELATRSFAGMALLIIGGVLWPSYWWLLIAFVVMAAVVMHPYCLVTGRKHAPGGHLLHFEDRHKGNENADRDTNV